MHPSEKIQRILNQSLKCSYAQTEVICSLYVHYVTIAGVENAGATKYGKPSEKNTLKHQTKYGCRGFLA